jgi:outer membrane protein TolC
MLKLIIAVPLTLVSLSGCVKYQVKPLQPEVRLSEFKARTLDEPSLIQYVNGNLRSPMAFPQPRWELPALTLVAFRNHPEIELARSRAAGVEAAITTASQRSNPNFSFGTTLETPFQDTLPWILTPALDLLFERPSERKFRTAEAGHLADAACWDIGATAWQVRSRLRTRFTDYVFAVRELELLREEEAIRSEYLSLLQAKLELGDVSRLEIEASRIELQRVRLRVNTAEGRVSETRAALPEALGLSAGAITALEFYDPRLENPVELTANQLQRLESDALLNRVDIYRALDQYAAAEAALQMEIAAQRPNFALGPAFRWREGQRRWTLGVSFDLPIFNRNQGPIAEAEARRETVARDFDRLQASVVAEVEQASATYKAAINERQSVNELNSAADDRLTATQQLFDLREVDYTTLVAARLEAALARTAGILALRRVHAALAMIEDAIQRPVDDEFSIPGDLAAACRQRDGEVKDR